MILSPQQQAVLETLIPIAEVATDGSRSGLPMLPRCHSLIVGPSGSGKSFLATQIARKLQLPCLVLNVASWILVSSRSEPWTWTHIAEWLATLKSGGVLVLDEIDKCGSNSEWSNYLRLEIHDILDGVIPVTAKLPGETADVWSDIPAPTPVAVERDKLATILRERVMVVGCGAWQGAWRGNSRQMGFSPPGPETLPEPPSREQILCSLDPELRQRFRDDIAVLPPMEASDYLAVAKAIALTIPQEVRAEWRAHLGAAIKKAMAGTLGMRVFEELLLQALVLSRQPRTAKPEVRGPESIGG